MGGSLGGILCQNLPPFQLRKEIRVDRRTLVGAGAGLEQRFDCRELPILRRHDERSDAQALAPHDFHRDEDTR